EAHCIICAEKIIHSAISPCNNVTCHVCSFRQRALYKKKTCLVCRTDHEDVIFTEQILEEAKFSEFVVESRQLESKEYEIHFTSQYVKDDTLKLILHECPVCQKLFKKYQFLSEHTKTEHSQQYCDVCVDHGNSFISELKLYTPKQLQRHMNEGDKSGFSGHPKCKFCRGKRFYSEDELNVHIRDRHERCFICNQDNYQASEYYRNYDDLYDHFRHAHYVCSIQLCVEKRFVVFREDLDLTAHMLKEHGGIVGQSGRIVLGASSAQFQSQLSTFTPRSQAKPHRDNDSINLKKRRLEERVKHYLLNDADKLARFEKINSGFKSRKISAADLVKQYRDLFSNNDIQDISLVLYEFVELQPTNSDQRASLQLALDEISYNETTPSLNNSFPMLSKSLDSHILRNLSWGAGIGNSRRSINDQFPALVKPTKANHRPINNGPIKYTTLLKKPANETKSFKSTQPYKENTLYRPSYLEPKSDLSIGSLPKLGLSSANPSRLQSPLFKGSKPKVSESKFPALPPKPKKTIPPVKPIPKVSGWGPATEMPKPQPKDDWGIPIIDKKAEKLRRK
ncbi:hypothetical protein METBIDRAFT_20395, partial [Metschnikowia bicuspidata var. bicuspidata NRRL YB-4993]